MPIPGAYNPGTLSDDRQLDGPPPSPALQQGQGNGTPLQADQVPGQGSKGGGINSLGVQPIPAGQMPPEVLTGILQGGESISTMLDSFAQITPDLGNDIAMIKQPLLAYMAKVLQSGGGPTSPVSTGNQFPGGGLDKGGGPPSLT